MRHYALTHQTRYHYAQPVTRSYGVFHQRPRELAWQQLHRYEVEVDPEPVERQPRTDHQGNHSTWFLVETEHTELAVTARSRISVGPQHHDPRALAAPWELARPAERADVAGAWRHVDLTLASPLVDVEAEVADYARPSFPPGRPIGEALLDLTQRIHADFEYRSGSTTISTRVGELLAERQGVCQDFAQLLIACLRSLGLAGRYVSGYLATTPPPGQARLVGADASHAWAGCWLPLPPGAERDGQGQDGRDGDADGSGAGTSARAGDWLYTDPTNDRFCDESHATVAWGRDYGDVAPLRGVVFSRGSGSELSVSVDMAPLEHPEAETELGGAALSE